MSAAALKATTVLSGLAILGLGANYTLKSSRSSEDFSTGALAAAEHAVPDAISAPMMKKRLPSNYFQFTLPGGYKVSNA